MVNVRTKIHTKKPWICSDCGLSVALETKLNETYESTFGDIWCYKCKGSDTLPENNEYYDYLGVVGLKFNKDKMPK